MFQYLFSSLNHLYLHTLFHVYIIFLTVTFVPCYDDIRNRLKALVDNIKNEQISPVTLGLLIEKVIYRDFFRTTFNLYNFNLYNIYQTFIFNLKSWFTTKSLSNRKVIKCKKREISCVLKTYLIRMIIKCS